MRSEDHIGKQKKYLITYMVVIIIGQSKMKKRFKATNIWLYENILRLSCTENVRNDEN